MLPRISGRPAAVTVLIIFGLGACADGDDPAAPADTTPPAAVADLRVVSFVGGIATLAWTAPGDDGTSGTASSYDLRYSGSALGAANWNAATPATGEPDPAAAGTGQTAIVDTGSDADAYFALKTGDEAANWSGLSNVVLATGGGGGGAFVVHQLTHNGNNIQPSLGDGHVVWVAANSVEGDEIWIANLRSPVPAPTRLTDNGGEKAHPSNHGAARIVWEGRASSSEDWEIWLYNEMAVPRYAAFTDNEVPDRFADLAGAGSFAWLQGHTMFEAVHYWNEYAHEEYLISDGCCPTAEWSNEIPSADSGAVLWRAYHRSVGSGYRANYWDGATVHVVTDNDYNDTDVCLHGTLLAWIGRPINLDEIFWTSVAE